MQLDPDIIGNGIPHMKYYTYYEGYKVIVMTKLGPNLKDVLEKAPNKKFTKKTVLKIAIQAVSNWFLSSKNFRLYERFFIFMNKFEDFRRFPTQKIDKNRRNSHCFAKFFISRWKFSSIYTPES